MISYKLLDAEEEEVIEEDDESEEVATLEVMDVDDEDLDETVPLESNEAMIHMDENLDTSVLSNKTMDSVNNLENSITESTNDFTVFEGTAAAVLLPSEVVSQDVFGSQSDSTVPESAPEPAEISSSLVDSDDLNSKSAQQVLDDADDEDMDLMNADVILPSEAGQGSRDVFISQYDSTIPESCSFDESIQNSSRVEEEVILTQIYT